MRSSLKAPQLARGLAPELVRRAVRGERPAIRRLQTALGRAGKPEALVVTILNFSDEAGSPHAPVGAPPSAAAAAVTLPVATSKAANSVEVPSPL